MKKLSVVRARQRERTRRSLMDAAVNVFSRYGYERSTVDLVAQSAGFSKGAFYVHFDSKESIFLEVLAEASRPLEAARPRTPAAIVDSYAELLVGRPHWAALVTEFSAHAWRNPRIGGVLALLWERCRTQLELAFVDSDNDGQASARQKAELVVALFRGLVSEPATNKEDAGRLFHAQLALLAQRTRSEHRSAA